MVPSQSSWVNKKVFLVYKMKVWPFFCSRHYLTEYVRFTTALPGRDSFHKSYDPFPMLFSDVQCTPSATRSPRQQRTRSFHRRCCWQWAEIPACSGSAASPPAGRGYRRTWGLADSPSLSLGLSLHHWHAHLRSRPFLQWHWDPQTP